MLEEAVVAVGVEQDVEPLNTPFGQVAPSQAQPALVPDEPALAANEIMLLHVYCRLSTASRVSDLKWKLTTEI
jgi:hypothetical protein